MPRPGGDDGDGRKIFVGGLPSPPMSTPSVRTLASSVRLRTCTCPVTRSSTGHAVRLSGPSNPNPLPRSLLTLTLTLTLTLGFGFVTYKEPRDAEDAARDWNG